MAARKKITKRMGLDDDILALLQRKHILTCQDLLLRTDLELLSELDIGYDQIQDTVLKVSKRISPQMNSLKAVMEAQASEDKPPIQTRLCFLDAFLRGGIPHSSITEIVGPGGQGKTQFCHYLVAMASLPVEMGGLGSDCNIVFFDTDRSFSINRVTQIAMALYPEGYQDPSAVVQLANRILVAEVPSVSEFTQTLEGMEEQLLEKNVKFIIVDSIASLIRKEFDSSNLAQRQHMLTKQASLLKYYAESLQIPVVVTNQVTARTDNLLADRFLTAALGIAWSHCVNTRLVLEGCTTTQIQLRSDTLPFGVQLRMMTIAKSPVSPVVVFPLTISDAGFALVEKRNQYNYVAPSDEPMDVEGDDDTAMQAEIDKYILQVDPCNYWTHQISHIQ